MKMDIKNTVIELLTQYSDFKDNDQSIGGVVLETRNGKDGLPIIQHYPRQTFFKLMAFGKLTSADTITRVRRLIQEETPRTAWEEVQRTPGKTKHC
jgi:hypothetical protein